MDSENHWKKKNHEDCSLLWVLSMEGENTETRLRHQAFKKEANLLNSYVSSQTVRTSTNLESRYATKLGLLFFPFPSAEGKITVPWPILCATNQIDQKTIFLSQPTYRIKCI